MVGLVAEVAAPMGTPVPVFAAKVCGPVIGPAGPMICSTWAGVKLLTAIGRSNCTFIVLVVPSVIRLPAAAPPLGTDVLTTCGPGTMIGRVFESYGRSGYSRPGSPRRCRRHA